eukprot:869930_1
MMLQFYLLVLSIIISSIYSKCNHYYQSSGPSSTKRPFDICYKSEIDNNLSPTSYRYYCIDSTPADYGNNSVTGYTAFREDFNDINCLGKPNRTRIVNKPFRILCENDNPTCEILRFRQYPIKNSSSCTYNQSIYVEDIQVIAICKDEGDTSEATFCNKKSDAGEGSYFWSNTYFNNSCENRRLFEATYQFHGCQGDGSTYLEILSCDYNFDGISSEVKPFGDSLFVSGFVLLLIAILCIVFILIWYCCWFKKGFIGSNKQRKGRQHVQTTSVDFDGDDDVNEENLQMSGNNQTTTMR